MTMNFLKEISEYYVSKEIL